MTTVTIDDALAARIRAVSPAEEDWRAFVADALRERVERVEREAAVEAAVEAGPRHAAAAVAERIRVKYGYPDLPAMTPQERADDAERIIAAMDPEARAGLERDGWL